MVRRYIFGLILSIYLVTENVAESSIEDFPYLASVQAPAIRGRRHVCNGAIINENWILTIGSCVSFFEDPHAFRIRVGGIDNYDGDDYTVVRREFHPLYSQNKSDYNLALLRVQTPLEFNDRVKTIDIVSTTLPIRADQTGELAGWGFSYEKRFEQPQLRLNSLEIVTLDTSDCDADNRDNKLCIQVITEPTPSGTCHGADGSVLVINDKLIALSTYGVGCSLESKKHIVTPINKEIQKWITETIK